MQSPAAQLESTRLDGEKSSLALATTRLLRVRWRDRRGKGGLTKPERALVEKPRQCYANHVQPPTDHRDCPSSPTNIPSGPTPPCATRLMKMSSALHQRLSDRHRAHRTQRLLCCPPLECVAL